MDYLNYEPPIKTKRGWANKIESSIKIGTGDVRKNLKEGVPEPKFPSFYSSLRKELQEKHLVDDMKTIMKKSYQEHIKRKEKYASNNKKTI